MASTSPLKNKDGVTYAFQIRVYRGRDADGRQIKPFQMVWRIPEGMKNSRSIQKKLDEVAAIFERDCKAGLISPEKKTFSAYAEYVMELKARDLKHRTVARYRELLVRLNEHFGHLKLTEITPKMLNDFYLTLAQAGNNKKTGGGLSAKTIKEYHNLLSSIFKFAKKEGLVPFNPADNASPPSVKRQEAKFFEIETVLQILAALEEEPLKWQVITRLLIDTGARRGEIAGLKWSAIDFKNNRIEIKNNLLYSRDRGIYEDSPKTGKSRIISVNAEVMKLLTRHRHEQTLLRFKMGEQWVNKDFCFTQDNGNPMHPDSITDFLSKFSKRHDLPHIHPHAFRHTQVSLLLHAGVDIVTVSKRVGHEQTSTTSNMYGHILAKADEGASNTISDLLYTKKTKQA